MTWVLRSDLLRSWTVVLVSSDRYPVWTIDPDRFGLWVRVNCSSSWRERKSSRLRQPAWNHLSFGWVTQIPTCIRWKVPPACYHYTCHIYMHVLYMYVYTMYNKQTKKVIRGNCDSAIFCGGMGFRSPKRRADHFLVDRERNGQMFDISKDVAHACVSCRRSRFKFDYKTFGGLPNVTPSLEKEKQFLGVSC